MTEQIALSVTESIALSTSVSALKIIQKGSPELITAFQSGAFADSEQGMIIRAPKIGIPGIERVGTCLFLIQLEALEFEMRSIGIQVTNQMEVYQ